MQEKQQLTIRYHSESESDIKAWVSIRWQSAEGLQTREASGGFDFALTEDERRDLQWYLEAYIQFPRGEFKTRAERVEAMLHTRGTELFSAVFGDISRLDLYDAVANDLPNTRFVIETEQNDLAGVAIPWELLRDPRREDGQIARHAAAFVRSQPLLPPPPTPHRDTKTFNILLIISRPQGSGELPYLADARPLLELFRSYGDRVRVDVLRPPTLQHLRYLLAQKPNYYHVIHFDGHGAFFTGPAHDGFSPTSRYEGTLAFETEKGYLHPVSGLELRQILVNQNISLIVLSACQSAMTRSNIVSPSVAHRLLRAGVGGVIAMGYSVSVSTSVQFMKRFYEVLIAGNDMGYAVQMAREDLAIHNQRGSHAVSVLDWIVPLVFETAPIFPCPKPIADHGNAQNLPIEVDCPSPPDPGFIGQDRTIYVMDQEFRKNRFLMLQGMSGVGKTETALFFARWWIASGGFKHDPDSRIFYAGFAEETITFPWIINRIGEAFQSLMQERVRIYWPSLAPLADTDIPLETLEQSPRYQAVLKFLRAVPCFLIMDGLDRRIGASGTHLRLGLNMFLRGLRGGASGVLMTSHYNEPWAKELSLRIGVPELTIPDAVELTNRILRQDGIPIPADKDALTKLHHTLRGNPRAIRSFLPLLSHVAPATLVERLQCGDPLLSDDPKQQAPVQSFSDNMHHLLDVLKETERNRLTLLSLFGQTVFIETLGRLCSEEGLTKTVPAFARGCTATDWQELLHRATGAGLVQYMGYSHVFQLHPLLQWLLRQQLQALVSDTPDWPDDAFISVYAQFEKILADTASEYPNTLLLRIEVTNLRRALEKAHVRHRYNDAARITVTLARFWKNQGDWDELETTVTELQQRIGATDRDLPPDGYETAWQILLGHRSALANHRRDFAAQEAIEQRLANHYEKTGQQDLLAATYYQRGNIARERRQFEEATRWYGISLQMRQKIGDKTGEHQILFQMGNLFHDRRQFEEAEEYYRRSYGICTFLNDLPGQATLIYHLGLIAEERLRSGLAETCYQRSLELMEQIGDGPGVARALHHLGIIARKRRQFTEAESFYQQSLAIREEMSDENGQALTLHQLGIVAQERRQWDESERWYRQSLAIRERSNDTAGQASLFLDLGTLAQEQGQFVVAEEWFRQSLNLTQQGSDQHAHASALYRLALLMERKGNIAEAKEMAQSALHLFRAMDSPQYIAIVQDILERLSRANPPTTSYMSPAPPALPLQKEPLLPLPPLSDDDDLLPLPSHK